VDRSGGVIQFRHGAHAIEVFPKLRRRCVAHDLIIRAVDQCGTSLPELIFISVECESFLAFYRVTHIAM